MVTLLFYLTIVTLEWLDLCLIPVITDEIFEVIQYGSKMMNTANLFLKNGKFNMN